MSHKSSGLNNKSCKKPALGRQRNCCLLPALKMEVTLSSETSELHGVIPQKVEFFITAAVGTQNATRNQAASVVFPRQIR
jgi:hypothetical protein